MTRQTAEPVDERLSGDLAAFFRAMFRRGELVFQEATCQDHYEHLLDAAAEQSLASPEWQSLASRIAGEGRLREALIEAGLILEALRIACRNELAPDIKAELERVCPMIRAALAARPSPGGE